MIGPIWLTCYFSLSVLNTSINISSSSLSIGIDVMWLLVCVTWMGEWGLASETSVGVVKTVVSITQMGELGLASEILVGVVKTVVSMSMQSISSVDSSLSYNMLH